MRTLVFGLLTTLFLSMSAVAFAEQDLTGWAANTYSSSVYGDLTYYTKQSGLTTQFYMVIPDSQIPEASFLGQMNTPGNTYEYSSPFGGNFLIEF